MSPINEDRSRSIIINELLISMMLNQAHKHLDIIIKFLVSLVPSTFSATSFMTGSPVQFVADAKARCARHTIYSILINIRYKI